MVIAIDGPAGTGKSTIAKLLAERMRLSGGRRLTYINSGSLYRAITLGCLRNGVNPEDSTGALEYAKKARISWEEGVYLEGENVEALLHSDRIDRHVAPLSANVEIRHVVNSIIRDIAAGLDIVVEGRDMTTVVFPDAEYRFYLDASVEERARRRHEQGVSGLGLEEIRKAIEQRDTIDRNKTEGSLKIAPGVMVFNTSDLTIEEVYDKLEGTITTI
jgi:cytidylate kinase